MEYNVYCVSNASTNIYKNVLTSFKNLFPNSLDIGDQKFEIGLVAVGIHLNYDSSPGLFQVRSNIIADVLSGDDFSTILYASSLPNKFKNQYFYHHVNRVNYYPVRHTNIGTISVKLTDVLGNKLPIKEGQPSIVHFHLKEKDKNMEHDITYVRLDSKVNAKLDFKNTNSSFWIHLKQPIHLKEGATMALTDISFPNTFTPLAKIENKFSQRMCFSVRTDEFPNKTQNAKTYSFIVPTFTCYDENSLVEKLNEFLPDAIKEKIKFGIIDGCFTVVNKTIAPFIFSIPNYLKNLLGFQEVQEKIENMFLNEKDRLATTSIRIRERDIFMASNKIQIRVLTPEVMVLYANFVEHSIVGNNFYPILKIMPTNFNKSTKNEDYTSMHFDYLQFIKCNTSYLDNMKFELRGLDGDLIEFGNERRIVLNIVIKNPK